MPHCVPPVPTSTNTLQKIKKPGNKPGTDSPISDIHREGTELENNTKHTAVRD